MVNLFSSLAKKIANIFTISKFTGTRKDDNTIQVQTSYDKTIEKKELFPYGFITKAREGQVIILCQGGNFDGAQILPIISTDKAPKIEEGDTAIYNEKVSIIITEDTIKLGGGDLGGLIKIEELKKELDKITQILQSIKTVIDSAQIPEPGNGSPSAFQTALKAALSGKMMPDYSNIENTKITHGTNN